MRHVQVQVATLLEGGPEAPEAEQRCGHATTAPPETLLVLAPVVTQKENEIW